MPTPRLSELLEGASFLKVKNGLKAPAGGNGWESFPPLTPEELSNWKGNIGIYIDRPFDEYSESHVCVDVDNIPVSEVVKHFPWLENTLFVYRDGEPDRGKFIFIKGVGEFPASNSTDVELVSTVGKQVVVHGHYDENEFSDSKKAAILKRRPLLSESVIRKQRQARRRH